jgi:hypothetical protein
MKVRTVIISSVAAVAVGVAVVQSCTAIATSAVGVAVIKKVLLGGVSKGVKVLKNKNEFLQSPLIDSAMPFWFKKNEQRFGKNFS